MSDDNQPPATVRQTTLELDSMPPGYEHCADEAEYVEQASQLAARVMEAVRVTFEAELAKEALLDDSVPAARVVAGYVGICNFLVLLRDSINTIGVSSGAVVKTLTSISPRTTELYGQLRVKP